MDNQNFINFTNNSGNQGRPINSIENERSIFKEIFATLYGVQNTSFLKEDYSYFDKYGKQRDIDIAVFTEKIKIAVIIEGKDSDIVEEYKSGDKRIVEVSLSSQGWEIYYWSDEGKISNLKKKTIKELQTLLGKEPKFLNHMHVSKEEPHKTNIVTPLLIAIALITAVILFPKISDKLFSTTKLSETKPKPEKNISVDYHKLGIKDKLQEEPIKKDDF